MVALQSEVNWRVPVARPLWPGLQVVVSEFEVFATERTNTGRDKKKRNVGEKGSMAGWMSDGGKEEKRPKMMASLESLFQFRIR